MGIAENIKRRRLELGISQQKLADLMGYSSRSTIAKIEKGVNEVPKNKMTRFATVLDTTIDYLLTGKETEKQFIQMKYTAEQGSHKNEVIILAGGRSTRNQQNIPNQFINVLGKPIIIYCMEAYQRHPAIDGIYVVCLKDWEGILEAYTDQYNINKLKGIISAGESGILSVQKGINVISETCHPDDTIILQESTRPLVTEEMISKLLNACKRNGSAVTCEPMNEYVQFELDNDSIEDSQNSKYMNRHKIVTVQSPEAYRFETIIEAFKKAREQKRKMDETCMAMFMYNLGYQLQFYEGNHNNIKVVRQEDIAVLSALIKSRL